MITSKQLATLIVNRVIFHDVPRNDHKGVVQPTLSEVETEIDTPRKYRLKTRLARVLGSKSAYAIFFNPASTSSVPGLVRSFTQLQHTAEQFVAMSQALAKHLFELQHGAISPGLLSVMDVAVDGQRGLTMMKLEREEGARLELTQRSGKTTFDMSVLDNLVLTDGTRLFKTVLFLRTGDGDDDFLASACDTQLNVVSSDDMAKFWLRFLGCTFAIEPRVATQRFYDSTLRFINENVTNPIHKNDLYEHLQSQLKASKKTLSPQTFIEDCVPSEYHKSFREHLTSNKVPLTSFTKDLSDINSRLRRLAYHTTHGALVSVPVEVEELVDVAKDRITVRDTLARVGTK